jgi:hypothetical protein
MKKSGILLAALLLSTFTLASSASAQTAPAPTPTAAAVQVAQPAAPLPDFLTAPATQSPDLTPAKGATGMEWLGGITNNICRCSKNSQCKTQGGACCFWPHQSCGICCGA